MSQLEHVLDLMRGSEHRWQSLRLEGHEWRNVVIFQRAWDHYFRQAPSGSSGARTFLFAATERGLPADETTEKWRMWISKPRKLRTEFQVGDHIVVAVTIGDHWWSKSPRGIETNNGDPSHSHGIGPAEGLLEPSRHVPFLEFEFAGHTRFASRSAIAVTAKPRPHGGPRADMSFHLLGAGADSYRFLVDSETGVLLRSQADFRGQAFRVIEVDDMGVNEPGREGVFDHEQL